MSDRLLFNELGQLERENNVDSEETIVYTYDNGGNITSKKIYDLTYDETPSGSYTPINYTYDSVWRDKLISYGNNDITYDEIGNPETYRDGMSFTWQGRQMKSANLNGTAVTYTYDADGLRTTKQVGSTLYEYEYVGGKLVYEKRGDIRFYYRYDALGQLASIKRINAAGTTYTVYAVTNSRGDIEELRHLNGSLIARYTYDTWGNTLSIVDASGNEITSSTALPVQNPFRYRGYYYDSESGLYYLQSRYYDPITCRFVSADKYLSTGTGVLGYNMYSYCENNPAKFIDNGGTFIGCIIGALIGGITGAVSAALNGDSVVKGAVIGAVTGGLSGLAVDAAVATGGVAGIVLAVAGGALASSANYAATEITNGRKPKAKTMVVEGVVGGASNLLSFGIGGGTLTKTSGSIINNLKDNAVESLMKNTTRMVNGQKAMKSTFGVIKNIAKNIFGDFSMSVAETFSATLVLERIKYCYE